MIAFLGEIIFESSKDDPEGPSGIKKNNLNKINILPRQRTDEVEVCWKH